VSTLLEREVSPNGAGPARERVDTLTLLSFTLKALSGHALKWVGLLLSFSLFAWIVVGPSGESAKLLAAMLFGGLVLALWFKKGS